MVAQQSSSRNPDSEREWKQGQKMMMGELCKRKGNYRRNLSVIETEEYFHEKLGSNENTFPYLTFPLLYSSQLSQGNYLYKQEIEEELWRRN